MTNKYAQGNEDHNIQRRNYRWFKGITTRWMDNDIYGHINNVHYYSYFDTIANSFLIEQGQFDIHNSDTVGYVVHSQCFYKSPIAYPQAIEGGFRVDKIGNSSVTYGLAIFPKGAEQACAYGTFTHVFVNRATDKPTPINDVLRKALTEVLVLPS